jgi:hypothetical protein
VAVGHGRAGSGPRRPVWDLVMRAPLGTVVASGDGVEMVRSADGGGETCAACEPPVLGKARGVEAAPVRWL